MAAIATNQIANTNAETPLNSNASPTPDVRKLLRILQHPTDGIVGLVDDLLVLGLEQGLAIDRQSEHCRVLSYGANGEEPLSISLSKSVFRAMLARLAHLCNERKPNSVSPYGGEGEVVVGTNPAAMLRVSFINTPAQQRLELSRVIHAGLEPGE